MLTWPIIFAGKSKRPTFVAIANYGRDCAFAGVRSGPRRVCRGDGKTACLRPIASGATKKTHDGTIVTDKVNEMWGTDMSQTVTIEEGRAYVFVAVEHANSEIIGIHAARSAVASRRWSRSGRKCIQCFGSIAPGVARGLKLRHDHGSNYLSGDVPSEIESSETASKLRRPSCASFRGQWRRRGASAEP